MKLSDGKLQNRHFFLFNGTNFSLSSLKFDPQLIFAYLDSLLYAKPTLLKKSDGLWVFCGQWPLDKIQIVDIPSPGALPPVVALRGSGELVRPLEHVNLRSSGGSEIIRSDRLLNGKLRTSAAEIFGGIGVSKTTDDTPSSSPSLYPSSPSLYPSSPSSLTSSSPSTPISPNSPAMGNGLRGSLTSNGVTQRAAIPFINLTPPPSPTLAPFAAAQARKHSHTESDAAAQKGDSTGMRIVIAEKRKSTEMLEEKAKAKESPGPTRNLAVRVDHKRSLSDSTGTFLPFFTSSSSSLLLLHSINSIFLLCFSFCLF
jgi:hypothetical protein